MPLKWAAIKLYWTIQPSLTKAAWKSLPDDQKNAINTARKNIKKFHQAQIPEDIEVETTKGVICRREARAIETMCQAEQRR